MLGSANRLLTLTLASFTALALACSSSDDAPTGSGGSSSAGSNASGSTAVGGSANAGNSTGGSSSAGTTSTGGSSKGGATNAGGSSKGGSSTAGTSGSDNTAGSAPTGDYWKPQAGTTWQWQLSSDVDEPMDVDVYDIDWEADESTVDKLHSAGIKVICYVSVGSWEDFRPDADDFPQDVIGNDYDGWPGEKYVDIRSDALRAVMSKRFDVCKEKGFDAIEPDNQDVYDLGSESGFPLTKQDGIAYAKWLADEAHSRGLGIGQKNAPNITKDIVALYDWALTESCYSDDDWCGDVEAYAKAGKPVFMCEYEKSSFNDACSAWKPKQFSPILKSLDLDEPVTFCP